MRTLKDVTKEEIVFFDLKLESCMKLMGENLNEVLEYCRRNDMEDVFGNYVELAFANLVHKVVSKESVNLFLNPKEGAQPPNILILRIVSNLDPKD